MPDTPASESSAGPLGPDPAPPRAQRWPLRTIRLILESLAALIILAVAISPWLSSLAWPIDLVANFTAQALFLTAALLIWAALFRRWKLLAIALLAGTAQVYALATPRAPWVTPSDPAADSANTIRLLHYNINPFNPRVEDATQLIENCDADLIVLIEPPHDLTAAINQKELFSSTNPHKIVRWPKSYANWQFVLSKWPLREYPIGVEDDGQPPFIAVIVDHPAKPFGFIVIHPASPRNARRWRVGNDLARAAADIVNRMRSDGLPVILTADLNGSATSSRGRLLAAKTDLRRAKPLTRPEGTFPSGLAWPASILLDDIWASPGFHIASWDTVSGAGSDHRAVVADILVLPPTPKSN